MQADANRLRAQLEERAESLNAAKKALAEIESKVHRATLATAKLKVISSSEKIVLIFCIFYICSN